MATKKRHPVGYFEIPVNDMERAVTFYKAVFGFTFQQFEMNGNKVALFPWQTISADDDTVDPAASGISGALMQGQGYVPGPQGFRLMFHTDCIEESLERALAAGFGKVLSPKAPIGPFGWVAVFEDSEGNAVSVNQPPPVDETTD